MEMTNGARLGIAMMGLGCARRALVEAMCYATLHETDGRVPWKTDRVTHELEDAGLVENGFIHGWLGRQSVPR